MGARDGLCRTQVNETATETVGWSRIGEGDSAATGVFTESCQTGPELLLST